jgi:hypothetical protein
MGAEPERLETGQHHRVELKSARAPACSQARGGVVRGVSLCH